MSLSEYHRGYQAAYQEFLDVLRTSDRPHGCGGNCNACKTIRLFIDHAFARMCILMSDEDFETFWDILDRTQMGNPASPIFEPEV